MRRRLARSSGIRFDRLTGAALVLAAVLPAAALGLVAYAQVERALADDAVVRTERAADAATLRLRQTQADLDGLAASYATWPVFQAMVEAGAQGTIRDDVVGFLVDQGTATAGRVDTKGGPVSVGDAVLAAELGRVPATVAGSPTVVDVGDAVYQVASLPVADPSGSGAIAGRITLARRLDAVFATGLATLTGYDVALTGSDGVADLATDPSSAGSAIAVTAGAGGVVRDGDLVATRRHIAGPDGGADLVLSSRVSALLEAAGGLPLLILGLLLATAVVALLLAWVLARVLRQRLAAVHEGLAAIADGRVRPTRLEPGGDDIARVAAGLDRLVAALDRREAVLQRSLAAAASVPIHLSAREAAAGLARAALEIFGFTWVRIVDPDGTILSRAGDADDGEGAMAEAPAGLGSDDRRLEAGLRPGSPWSDGDQASLEVMALLAGGVIAEAVELGEAANRVDRLDRLNRLQREFLRGVSHNLRAPLATIELAASDLIEADDAFVRQRAEAIRTEERRLARLVSEVLLLSRMESGTLELEGEPVALAPLARRVAAELGLAERVAVDERADGAVAIADESAVEQIAWVLLDNAARYAPSGPIEVEVRAAQTPNGEAALVMAIRDHGPGLTPADERHVFRRFARGAASAGTEGTGIGLSVARGLARALGGDVAYRRGAGGACFEVTLPSSGPAAEAELGSGHARRDR